MYLFILINYPIVIVTGAVINLYIHTESIIGETVILPCENEQGNSSGVQWTRLDKNTKNYFTTVYTDGWRVNTDLQIYERLKIVGERGGEDYGLQISSVTMLDSGLYRCAVDTITNLTYHFVTLEVKDKYEDMRTVQFTTNIDDSRVFSSVPIVSILSIPLTIVVMLASITAILLCQTRRTNKVSLPVNNQTVGIDEVQQSENHYDEIDYEEMACEVQNSSMSDTSLYLIPVSENVETICVKDENSSTNYEEMACEVQNNSMSDTSSYLIPVSENVETIRVNDENSSTNYEEMACEVQNNSMSDTSSYLIPVSENIETIRVNDENSSTNYEEMACEVQNNSMSDTSSYLIPVSENVETVLVNEENSSTGSSQEIDGNSQANVSERTYDNSYDSNLYQPLTENWGSYCRTYAQCPPCQTVSGNHNIADPSQICNMYQHMLPRGEDAKHVYS